MLYVYSSRTLLTISAADVNISLEAVSFTLTSVAMLVQQRSGDVLFGDVLTDCSGDVLVIHTGTFWFGDVLTGHQLAIFQKRLKIRA